ncbi:hypothetical protein SRHO_G00041090 [Serrasalmus rhombeus]
MNDNDLAEDLGCAGGIDRRIIRGPVLLIISGEVIRGMGVGALSAVTICQWDEVCCKGQLTGTQTEPRALQRQEKVKIPNEEKRAAINTVSHRTRSDKQTPLGGGAVVKASLCSATGTRRHFVVKQPPVMMDTSGGQESELSCSGDASFCLPSEKPFTEASAGTPSGPERAREKREREEP